MKLDEAVRQRLADWRPAAGRHTLTVPDQGAGWTAVLCADRSDALGCLAWELTLRRSQAPAADVDALRDWAERSVRQATGLLEPLAVVEVDGPRGQALLRSREPAQRGDDLFYYEVLLTGVHEAQLRRYRASHRGADRREQVGFTLTHEALAKLAADLTA
jgi:hypothetical protein